MASLFQKSRPIFAQTTGFHPFQMKRTISTFSSSSFLGKSTLAFSRVMFANNSHFKAGYRFNSSKKPFSQGGQKPFPQSGQQQQQSQQKNPLKDEDLVKRFQKLKKQLAVAVQNNLDEYSDPIQFLQKLTRNFEKTWKLERTPKNEVLLQHKVLTNVSVTFSLESRSEEEVEEREEFEEEEEQEQEEIVEAEEIEIKGDKNQAIFRQEGGIKRLEDLKPEDLDIEENYLPAVDLQININFENISTWNLHSRITSQSEIIIEELEVIEKTGKEETCLPTSFDGLPDDVQDAINNLLRGIGLNNEFASQIQKYVDFNNSYEELRVLKSLQTAAAL